MTSEGDSDVRGGVVTSEGQRRGSDVRRGVVTSEEG